MDSASDGDATCRSRQRHVPQHIGAAHSGRVLGLSAKDVLMSSSSRRNRNKLGGHAAVAPGVIRSFSDGEGGGSLGATGIGIGIGTGAGASAGTGTGAAPGLKATAVRAQERSPGSSAPMAAGVPVHHAPRHAHNHRTLVARGGTILNVEGTPAPSGTSGSAAGGSSAMGGVGSVAGGSGTTSTGAGLPSGWGMAPGLQGEGGQSGTQGTSAMASGVDGWDFPAASQQQ